MGEEIESVSQRIFTIEDWVNKKKNPPENTIRKLIFNAEENGFSSVIRRIGRRIYLVEEEFYRWLDEQNHNANG